MLNINVVNSSILPLEISKIIPLMLPNTAIYISWVSLLNMSYIKTHLICIIFEIGQEATWNFENKKEALSHVT